MRYRPVLFLDYDYGINPNLYFSMKNLTVFILALVLVCVLFVAGVNGILRGHASGPLFLFLGACAGVGLAIDVNKLWKEKVRQSNAKKFGR